MTLDPGVRARVVAVGVDAGVVVKPPTPTPAALILLYDGDVVGVSEWTIDSGLFSDSGIENPIAGDNRVAPYTNSLYLFGDTSVSAVMHRDIEIPFDNVPFRLSGWLGGFGNQDDNSEIEIEWRDVGDNRLGEERLKPVLADERGDVTNFLLRESFGIIPVGTVSARVTITMTRFVAGNNDGYVDGLVLEIDAGANVTQTLIYDGDVITVADGWTVITGSMVDDDLRAVPNDRPPPYGDSNYSYGGNNIVSEMQKDFAVPGEMVVCCLSAWLGGFDDGNDKPAVIVDWRDIGDISLGTFQIGPLTVQDRDFTTKFLLRQFTDQIPVGAVVARVTIESRRFTGSSNDGWADAVELRYRDGSI